MFIRYIIFAPSYSPNAGGTVVLHKLCDLINKSGRDAVLYPFFPQFKINKKNLSELIPFVRNSVGSFFRGYKTNASFNTPIFSGQILDSDIVVYPEIVFGNPLRAKNVVRWLLHKPGNFTGEVFYGSKELYFKFDHGLVDDFSYYGSKVSNNILKILHIPNDIYNQDGVSLERCGTAYSIRKGTNKPAVHHPKDAILIDGMSHEDIAKVFKKVKTFISYDSYSAYSTFAILCGCDSIVIPEKDLSKYDWYPDERNRYGIAYGIEDVKCARETAKLKLDLIKNYDAANTAAVEKFINETEVYFNTVTC